MKELRVKLREAHKTNAQFGLILLSFVIYGLACLFDTNNPVYVILLAVASTIIATLIAGYVERRYCGGDIERLMTENLEDMQKQCKKNIDAMQENFPVLKSCHTYGLIGIACANFPLSEAPYRNDFINSERVIIVMNDAKHFLSDNNNNLLLQERLKATDKETIFILLDNKNQWLMSTLAKRNGHGDDENYYVRKISAVIKQIEKLNSEAEEHNHKVRLFLYDNFNTLAMILTDNYVMESTYRLAPEKTSVPHFIFEKGGKEYYYAKQDISEKLFSLNEDGTYKYIREMPL